MTLHSTFFSFLFEKKRTKDERTNRSKRQKKKQKDLFLLKEPFGFKSFFFHFQTFLWTCGVIYKHIQNACRGWQTSNRLPLGYRPIKTIVHPWHLRFDGPAPMSPPPTFPQAHVLLSQRSHRLQPPSQACSRLISFFLFFFFDFTVDYARAMDLFNKEGQSDGDMAMADRSNSGTVPHNGTRLRCKWPCTRSPLEHISDLCIFFPLWHADSASAMSILTTAEDHQTPLTSRMALAAASG